MPTLPIYALDFDGVICDSAVETGITGGKVAAQLWPEMPAEPTKEMIDLFRQVRPVMETGYEAILIMRLLFEGVTTQTLLDNFSATIAAIIKRESLSVSQLKSLFGGTRDHWIKQNLKEWLEMNPLFEGITNKLRGIAPKQCYIITTKQERFVSQILDANNIAFPPEQIFGLDRKRSKPQILVDLLAAHPKTTILFVEDRLPTLIDVINDDRLSDVKLFFADWGYNTQQDKSAAGSLAINNLNLAGFSAL
ncbi:MAG: HAD family hydrolase [Methylophagaceae bacterium]